jgi:hypothetical protein
MNLLIAAHRLRQHNSQYPLLHLKIAPSLCTSPLLLSAIAASTTLVSLTCSLEVRGALPALLASVLKALPSLRFVDLRDFPIDAAVELLQSRTNWEHIILPHEPNELAQTTFFAALNASDFQLDIEPPDRSDSSCFKPWLANPHLTSLVSQGACDEHYFDVLQDCQNLTHLVCAFSLSFLALPPKSLSLRVP